MRPLWVDPNARRFPALDRDLQVDVAIVGGGLSGLGAAYSLSGTGHSVALLEARAIGSGASGRNAGFLLHGPAMPFAQAVRALGPEAALEIWRFTEANNRLMVELAHELPAGCGYLRRGSVSLAASRAELEEFADSGRDLAEAGIATCLVKREQLPVPFDELYAGGLWYPGNGEIDPGRFLQAAADRLRDSIAIFEGSPVIELRHGHGWELCTPVACLRAGRVVLATNAYTATLLPGIPIEARRGQVLATAPIDRVVVPFPMYADRGFQYWRQTPEGRLVVGGWRDRDLDGEVGLEERLHADIQHLLDTFCARVMGAPTPAEHRWSGAMGFTPDHLPVVGPVPEAPELWIAAGYSGHGVCMAFLCGHAAGLAAAGGMPHVPRAFDPRRFAIAVADEPLAASSAALPDRWVPPRDERDRA